VPQGRGAFEDARHALLQSGRIHADMTLMSNAGWKPWHKLTLGTMVAILAVVMSGCGSKPPPPRPVVEPIGGWKGRVVPLAERVQEYLDANGETPLIGHVTSCTTAGARWTCEIRRPSGKVETWTVAHKTGSDVVDGVVG
jgi:hypothetical protein